MTNKTAAPDVDALLAQALDELRALPAEKVRQVLEAARGALARGLAIVPLDGTVRGSAQLSGELTVTGRMAGGAELVEAATATDALDVEVLSPAAGSLLKLLKENAALVTAIIALANTCAGLLREQGGSRVTTNITVVQQLAPAPMPPPPPSAPAEERAPGRELVCEPPPHP